MSANTLPAFTFEGSNVRVFMINNEPWFAATDVARCIGIKDPKDAVKNLRSCERSGFKPERGGSLTIISESGMYTMVLRSDAAIKEGTAAFRFRVWVTDEVLPAIRKQGRYECPTQTITPEEQLAIQLAVSHRAKKTSSHYQTIYRAIKVRYQIAKYDQLPRSQFEDCLRFVKSVDLNVPIARSEHTLPEERFLSDSELIALKNLHRFHCDPFWKNCALAAYKVLAAADSTFAGRFYDLIHEPIFSLLRVEEILNRNGIRIAY